MRRVIGVVFAIVVLAASTAAQETNDVARMWSYYEAGIKGDASEVDRLLARLAEKPADQRETAIIIDSLIRLNAKVPVGRLDSIASDFPAEAVILASRDVTSHRELLFQIAAVTKDSVHRLAAWTLLADRRDPEIAAVLLEGAEIQILVDVVSPDQGIGPGSGYNMSGCGGWNIQGRHCELPPVTSYKLSTWIRAGSTVLTDGPQPITYSRIEYECRRVQEWSSGPTDIPEMRFRLARWMTGDRNFSRVDSVIYDEVTWTNADGLREAIDGLKLERLNEFRAIVESLEREHLLTGAEARNLRPLLAVTVTDRRQDKRDILPNLEGVEIVTLDWGSDEEESSETTDESGDEY